MIPNALEIRRLRKEASLSQQQLAELARIDERTISRIENERRPQRRERYVLETVARVLGEILSRPITVYDITLPDPDDAPAPPENLWGRVVLCVAAAGPPPDGLPSNLGVDTVLMVQVGGRPIIHWQLTYARRLGIKYVKIAVRKLPTSAEAYARFVFPDLEFEFFVPDDLNRGPGYTVTTLLRRVSSAALPGVDAALVELGDTAFEFKATDGGQPPRPKGACVLWSTPPDTHRWATSSYGGSKRGGKGDRPVFAEHGGGKEALIGVYYLNDLNLLLKCAEKLASVPEPKEIQVTDLLNALTDRDYNIDRIQAAEWYDVGHEDMRFKAHQDLLQRGSGSRVFHALKFNTGPGLVWKGMNIPDPQRCEALIEQIHYLAHLPKCYAPYFPQLLDYNDRWPGVDADDGHNSSVSGPWYKQAYIPFPSAAQLYVFGQLHPDTWTAIFVAIRRIMDDFARYWRPASPTAIRQAYVTKTEKRLDDLLKQIAQKTAPTPEEIKIQALLTRQQLEIGGCKYEGLRTFLNHRAYKDVDRIANQAERFTVISGDLCASNILVDLSTGMLKIIDPRGSFGGMKGIYGHALYDLAKLYHSWVCRYDFIVNDLFKLDGPGTCPILEISEPRQYEEVCGRFKDVFFGDDSGIARDTLLVTALLFTSMLPLHGESTRRQLAFLCQAIKLFNEWA